jgi:predicted PolB exonuclease-like 3'-5' exonuclease
MPQKKKNNGETDMPAKLVFDIETSALSDDDLLSVIPFVDTKEPPRGNIKLEETWKKKVKEWNAPQASKKRETEHIDKLKKRGALDPLTGHVLAIGVKFDKGDGEEVKIFEGIEKTMLEDFWTLLGWFTQRAEPVYTYNGTSFDLPFLVNRSRLYRIKPSNYLGRPLVNDYGKLPTTFVDIAKVWSGPYRGNFDMPRFEQLCSLFSIKAKSDGFRGDSFSRLYRTDNDRAMQYLEEEVTALWSLSDYFSNI